MSMQRNTARLWPRVIAFGLLSAASAIGSAQTRPPNIVVIVGDDMGYADIGVHGARDIPTPNIDALAASASMLGVGMSFAPCTPMSA